MSQPEPSFLLSAGVAQTVQRVLGVAFGLYCLVFLRNKVILGTFWSHHLCTYIIYRYISRSFKHLEPRFMNFGESKEEVLHRTEQARKASAALNSFIWSNYISLNTKRWIFCRVIEIILTFLTPNVNYSGRTAPLTSKVTFCIFIQQI